MRHQFSWRARKTWHGYATVNVHWGRPWWVNFTFCVSLCLFPPHVILRLPGLFLEWCGPVDARPIWDKKCPAKEA